MADVRHVIHGASESTALLQTSSPSAATQDTAAPPDQQRQHRKWRVIFLLYTLIFLMMLGDTLYPAALVQVLEDIICADTYGTAPSSGAAAAATALAAGRRLLQDRDHGPDGDADVCKSRPVQTELALVRGFQQLAPIFAGVLGTVPFTLLADRIGRRPVLTLSCAGMALSYAWVVAVCYFRFLPARWIWLSGAFLFVGGGDPVLSSVAHVMITDTTERAERAQIFLCLHAADVTAGFFGPAIGAALMETGHLWTVLLLAAAISFFAAAVITSLIPETLHLSKSTHVSTPITPSTISSPAGDPASSWSSSEPTTDEPSGKSFTKLFAPLRSLLETNRQALLLLCVLAPQTAARELFNSIGLQYSSVKFGLSYGRGSVLLSLFQGAQGLLALVLLPFITRTVAVPMGWSPWTRDRLYTVVSIGAIASGLLVVALSPALFVEIVGLLLISLGSCTNGLLMSLMGGAVRPDQIGAIYSAGLMLSIIVRSVTGPAFNGLFVAGMQLGWVWLGLPFAVMAALMACEFGASLFIRAERDEDGRVSSTVLS